MNRGLGCIAVCGKGGVGKTAFIAMLTQALVEDSRTGRLLVIDADPVVGLSSALGINANKTIGYVQERILDAATAEEASQQKSIVSDLDYLIMEAIVEEKDFTYLAMGRSESRGCYCAINNLLQLAITSLTNAFDTILIDGEAGLEQINRQVTKSLDSLLILTDSSNRGRETIGHIKRMVTQENAINCANVQIIINRVPSNINRDTLIDLVGIQGIGIAGIIPLDTTVVDFDLAGRSLRELPELSPALVAVRQIKEQLNFR